jgi:hypothetical protein
MSWSLGELTLRLRRELLPVAARLEGAASRADCCGWTCGPLEEG